MIGDTPPTRTADQRRAERVAVEATVSMKLESDHFEGVSDNLSEIGVMFFTDQPLRCVVEVEEGGRTRKVSGRLVRLQRMNETNTGLAIEFDAD